MSPVGQSVGWYMLWILYPSFLKGLLEKDGKLEFPMKIGAVQDILFLRISWAVKTRKMWPSVTIVSGPKCWYIQWILYLSVLKEPLEKDGKLDFHENRHSAWHTLPKYICDFFSPSFLHFSPIWMRFCTGDVHKCCWVSLWKWCAVTAVLHFGV